jgi:hypothetical protein
MALLTALLHCLGEVRKLFQLREELFSLNIETPERLVDHLRAVKDALAEQHARYLSLMSGEFQKHTNAVID